MTLYYDSRVYVSRVSDPYWLAIPEDERQAIADAVPEGHRLVIVPGHHDKPGTADIQVRTGTNQSAGGVIRGYVTAARCRTAIRLSSEHWRDAGRGYVVTTDAAGWVESIEERE